MSVAISEDEKIIGEINLNSGYTHAQILLPAINNLLKLLKLTPNKINYVACAFGPGSYTGLKIGVSTAKAFAHALNIKIIGVSTLDAMAYTMRELYDFNNSDIILVPLINSRRDEVYSAIYKLDKNNACGFKRLSSYLNDKLDKIIDQANNFDSKIIFCGSEINISSNILIRNMNLNFASSVSKLAINFIKQDINIYSYYDFRPCYLRKVHIG
jgi:tRNA threonylcarbamoyladenosine biosynthesis protein TsaB